MHITGISWSQMAKKEICWLPVGVASVGFATVCLSVAMAAQRTAIITGNVIIISIGLRYLVLDLNSMMVAEYSAIKDSLFHELHGSMITILRIYFKQLNS